VKFFFKKKFYGLLFGFLFFYYFSHFIFNFLKFLCISILWFRDFRKEFWKIMEYFSKKYRHLKSKILYKFHCLLFVFFFFFFLYFFFFFFFFCFFSTLVIFFSCFTYPNLSKTSKHFCDALLYGL